MVQFRGIIKWPSLIVVLLLVVFNYYAFLEILDFVLISPLDGYLYSLGYLFSIKEPLLLLFEKGLPGFSLIAFVLNINKSNFRESIKHFYSTISVLQPLIYMILLAILLYMQNNFFMNLKKYYAK